MIAFNVGSCLTWLTIFCLQSLTGGIQLSLKNKILSLSTLQELQSKLMLLTKEVVKHKERSIQYFDEVKSNSSSHILRL